MTTDQLATVVALGLRILSVRVLIVLALLADAVMFGWAMWLGGWDRLAVAGAFAAAAWFTVHMRREG